MNPQNTTIIIKVANNNSDKSSFKANRTQLKIFLMRHYCIFLLYLTKNVVM